jgi:predicted Zn-dependent peptidase
MYEYLRIQKGIAYSPGAWFSAKKDYGVFHIMADVDIDEMDGAHASMWEVIEEVSGGKVKPEKFKEVRRDLLFGMTRGYQTNSEKADYYAQVYYEIDSGEKFTNDEDLLERVTPKDVVSVAKKYFRNNRSVSVRNKPTITYTQLITLIIVFVIILLVLVLFIIRRRRKRRKRRTGLEVEGLFRR